jgi:hypothetical protein
MKFDGANWVTVGSAGFSAGYVWFISLALDNGTPYVAYQDYAAGHKATVMKFADDPPTTIKKSFKSVATHDGWILESTETSGVGGTKNSGAATLRMGDDVANRQYRSILSFNTSSLPDNAVITKVLLKFKKHSVVGTNPFTTHRKIAVDIRKDAFSKNAALQLTDFQAAASGPGVGLFANNPQPGGWYFARLNPAAYSFINRTGIIQFRLRFQTDDNNDFGADFLSIYSGNTLALNRPQLIIEYYVP